MSSMVSRWPVLISAPVGDDDLEPSGALRREAVERVFGEARAVYLTSCRSLRGHALEVRAVSVVPHGATVEHGEVTVSVSVVEIFPDRFTMHARIRPASGDGIAADATADVVPDGAVTDEVRDELIALAHDARHYH